MKSKREILITGATGYVGGLLLAALAKRREELDALVALDVRAASERLPGVDYVEMSVTDRGIREVITRQGVDTVVHLASVLRPPAQGRRGSRVRGRRGGHRERARGLCRDAASAASS